MTGEGLESFGQTLGRRLVVPPQFAQETLQHLLRGCICGLLICVLDLRPLDSLTQPVRSRTSHVSRGRLDLCADAVDLHLQLSNAAWRT